MCFLTMTVNRRALYTGFVSILLGTALIICLSREKKKSDAEEEEKSLEAKRSVRSCFQLCCRLIWEHQDQDLEPGPNGE